MYDPQKTCIRFIIYYSVTISPLQNAFIKNTFQLYFFGFKKEQNHRMLPHPLKFTTSAEAVQ